MRSIAVACALIGAALAQNANMDQPGTPPGVPDEYDCAFRKAAYEYGIKLRPDRGTFRTLVWLPFSCAAAMAVMRRCAR